MFRSYGNTLRSFGIAASLAFFAASLLGQARTPVVPNRIVQAIDDNSRVTLHGYVHPLANAGNDRGPASDSTPLERMHLVLKRSVSQEAALQQLVAGMHTPGDANFHKWLTPDEFGKQFGPSDQDIATVESWLASQGFQVTGVKPGRQVIEFTGNVAQVRNAFHTQIHQYVVNGSTHFAAATDPQIPAAIAPVVGGFVSLNNFRPKQHAHVLGQAMWDPKTHLATPTPTWTYGNTQNPLYVLTPGDFGVEYDLPNAALNPGYSGTTYDGAGQSIAIINESNINLELVNQFRSMFLPPTYPANPPTVIVDGNDPGIDGVNNSDGPNYASAETYIDVEWAGAVAPRANVDLVIAADTDLEAGLYLAMERAIYGNIAPVMSISFGACESALGSTNLYLNQLWEQAAAQGITVMVSSGDGGAAGCDNFNSAEYAVHGVAVSGYASTPWNVAVGGTDFYYSDYATGGASRSTFWNSTVTQTPQASIQKYIQEKPWNDSQYGLNARDYHALTGATTIAGGGGGASSAGFCSAGYGTNGACSGTATGYPKPGWQKGTGVPSDGVRDLPDVSLFAADGLNYSFYPFCYADGDCQTTSDPMQISGAGGTSFAAPAFAGIMALINQKYGPQGQANFVLYPLKAQYPAAFHDVTVGTIAVPCNASAIFSGGSSVPPVNCTAVTNPLSSSTGTVEGELSVNNAPAYNAAAGYNLATGLGSVDAAVMLADWGNVHFASSSVTLTPSSTSFTHGTAVTINGTVTGAGTVGGNVALMTDSAEAGQQSANLGQVLAGQASTFAVGSNGGFSGSVSDLPGGTYDIWGHYGGDGTNAQGDSAKTQITVNPEDSSVALSLTSAAATMGAGSPIPSGSTSVSYGTQASMTAQVAPTTYYNTCVKVTSPPSSCKTTTYTPPSGTVTFTDNGNTVNTAAINVGGTAAFNAPFSVGTHSVTASYSGDNSYNKASSSSIGFTVIQNTPNVFVSYANQDQSQNVIGGQPTVFYVLIENSANYNSENQYGVAMSSPVTPPTGTITVSGPSSLISGGTVTVALVPAVDPSFQQAAGVAQVMFPANAAAGTYNLSVTYSGDKNYTALTGSNAVSGSITIRSTNLLATTMTANLSSTTITPVQSATVTGTVTGQSGHPAPTGSVYVFFNGNWVTSYALRAGTGSSSTFSGNLTSQVLAQGSNIVNLFYAGDSIYNSNSFLLNSGDAIATPGSDFALTASSGLVAVSTTGKNNLSTTSTTTLYITPTNGFSGTVNLSVPANCGVASGLTCSLSQSSVALTYSNTATAAPHGDRLRFLVGGGGATLACVLLLTIPARRRAWRNMLSLIVFVCIAGFTLGCGGGNPGVGTCNLGPVCTSGSGGNGGTGGNTGPGDATNSAQSVTLTLTAASGVAVGHYGVTVTATSSATHQSHTLGVVAQVE